MPWAAARLSSGHRTPRRCSGGLDATRWFVESPRCDPSYDRPHGRRGSAPDRTSIVVEGPHDPGSSPQPRVLPTDSAEPVRALLPSPLLAVRALCRRDACGVGALLDITGSRYRL